MMKEVKKNQGAAQEKIGRNKREPVWKKKEKEGV